MITRPGTDRQTWLRGARWFALCVVMLLAVACNDSTSPNGAELTIRRAQWDAQHIASYQYDFLVTGFFINYEGRPIRIVVRDGIVQSAVFIDDGQPASGRPSDWPTIDQLFARAASARTGGALSGIRYDSRYDFPTQIDISGPPDAGGSLFATNFEVTR